MRPIIIGNFVYHDENFDLKKVRKDLKTNSKESLIEMVISLSLDLEKESNKLVTLRNELMIGKKTIGGITV